MRVVFFHRKPRPGNFSIEQLFGMVREALPHEVKWEIKVLSKFSNGFFKRLYISLEAAINQRDVNHITGDVNFIALFVKGSRTVLTIHDLGFLANPNKLQRLILHWFWIILPVHKSAIITTVSLATRNELLKWVSVKETKIRVIYNPISDLFIPAPKVFSKSNPRILQIGTKANKNIPRLLEALRGIPCVLELVGPMNESLLKALTDSGVSYVHYANLSLHQMVERYHLADIVAFASLFEGFGMPIVEANAVGRVVVTSSVSSMPEIANGAAHLVNPYDINSMREGFLKVINDDVYREELIYRGFQNKKRFDVHTIADQYAEIYRHLIKT